MIVLTLIVFPVFAVGFVAGRTPGRAVMEPVALRGGAASAVEGTDLADRFGLSPGSLTVGYKFGAGRGSDTKGAAARNSRPTTHGLYRGHTARYYAMWVRNRTRQLQVARAQTKAALGRIKQLKQQLRRRHTSAATSTPSSGTGYGVWDHLADCESGGNWSYNGSSGFDGGLQFSPSTWTAYKLRGYPAYAYQASREQQIAVAERVLADTGWGAWPACSTALGLR